MLARSHAMSLTPCWTSDSLSHATKALRHRLFSSSKVFNSELLGFLKIVQSVLRLGTVAPGVNRKYSPITVITALYKTPSLSSLIITILTYPA